MKKLLAVCLLILCLSFPVFAGHTQVGEYACSCSTVGCIEDYPGECSGHGATQQSSTPTDLGSESLLVLAALVLWLRLKS